MVAVSFAFGASIRAALTDALLPQIAIDATFLQPAHAVDTVVEMVRIILSHASFTLWIPFLSIWRVSAAKSGEALLGLWRGRPHQVVGQVQEAPVVYCPR